MGCRVCKNSTFDYYDDGTNGARSPSPENAEDCHTRDFLNNFRSTISQNNTKACRALLKRSKGKNRIDDLNNIFSSFENNFGNGGSSKQLPIIHLACMYRRDDVVNVLLQRDASLTSTTDSYGRKPICTCLRYWPRVWPKLINSMDSVDETVFWKSISEQIHHSSMCLQSLLNHGADPSEKMEFGRTLLHYAASKELKDAIQILIQNGADLGAKDFDGCTPMLLAAASGRTNSVMELLSHGADVNITDNNGWSILHFLCHCDFVTAETTNKIIKAGKFCDINSKTTEGMTPLHVAAERGNGEKIELLMNVGANADITDNLGRTALFVMLDNHEPAYCSLGLSILCSEMKQIYVYDKYRFQPKKLCLPNHRLLHKKLEYLSNHPSSLYFLCVQTIRHTLGRSRVTTPNVLKLCLPTSMVIDIIDHNIVME